ncbi:MAG: hypothetical protein WA900_01885 [Casimicrobiaceae bacterium]
MNVSKFLVSSAAAIAIVGAVSFAYAQTSTPSTPTSDATTAQTPAASPVTDTTTAQTPAASPTDATTTNSTLNSGGSAATTSTELPAKAARH